METEKRQHLSVTRLVQTKAGDEIVSCDYLVPDMIFWEKLHATLLGAMSKNLDYTSDKNENCLDLNFKY